MSKKDGLLGSRVSYKPFSYPWAIEGYDQMQSMHWLIEEIPLAEDIVDWNKKLTPEEKNLLTQILLFFTQQDCDVASAYLKKYIPAFGGHPEIAMMLSAFATSECNHQKAYSMLLDTLGFPESAFSAFQDYAEMKEKHEYLFEDRMKKLGLSKKEALALDVAVFSGGAEGTQLFASFAMLLSFNNRGLLKGTGTVVEWSVKDENLHVEYMSKLFKVFIEENPKIWTDEFKRHIYQTFREIVDLEDKFIDLAFEQGPIEGITPESVKEYVRYIADRRLNQLGLKSNYGIDKNPFPWLDDMLALPVHTNFFEGRATEYSKQGLEGWDQVWNDKET